MEEQWKEIPGYDGYLVSNFGRVKSFKFKTPRILKTKSHKLNCYLYVTVYKNGKYKLFDIHRLVATAFIPNPNNKPEVNHINGIKTDNRVENLEWTTHKENMQHAFLVGLNYSHQRKLTDEQVTYIRNNPDHLTQEQLSVIFGVNRAVISYAQCGKTYKSAGGFICVKHETPRRVSDKIRGEIKMLHSQGLKGKEIAAKVGVHLRTVWRIIHGRR